MPTKSYQQRKRPRTSRFVSGLAALLGITIAGLILHGPDFYQLQLYQIVFLALLAYVVGRGIFDLLTFKPSRTENFNQDATSADLQERN